MSADVNSNRPFDARLFLTDQELDRGVALMMAGGREMSAVLEDARRTTGLSRAEAQILLAIRHAPGVTVGELREALAMTVPTFARLIGELDKRGLVARDRARTDRRRRHLTLSDAGMTLTTPIAIKLRDRLRAAYRAAGPDAVAGASLLLDALKR